MSSRVAVQQFVSTYEPSSVQIGDEWYNPSTDRLYKRTITSRGVEWIELIFSTVSTTSTSVISGGVSLGGGRAVVLTSTLAAKALSNVALTLPSSQTYTLSDSRQYLDVYVDGYKLIKNIDYQEATVSSITPLISIPVGSTIEYRISQ